MNQHVKSPYSPGRLRFRRVGLCGAGRGNSSLVAAMRRKRLGRDMVRGVTMVNAGRDLRRRSGGSLVADGGSACRASDLVAGLLCQS